MDARAIQGIERVRDVGYTTRLENLHTDAKLLRCRLDRLELQWTRGGIPQHADAGQRRNGLDEQLQALCAEIGKIQEHTSDVTARARKASDKAAGYRITLQVDRNHWNARRRTGCRLDSGRGCRHDDVNSIADQLRRECRQARNVPIGKTDDYLEARVALVVRASQTLTDCGNAHIHNRR